MEASPNLAESVIYIESLKPRSIVIDFVDNKIVSKLRRSDNKIYADIIEDIINNKYNYISLQYQLKEKLPRADNRIFLKNDKNLRNGLKKLGMVTCLRGNWSDEMIYKWDDKIKQLDCDFIKCDIYYTEKVDIIYPITIFPVVDFYHRSFIKFSPTKKINKDSLNQFCKTAIGSSRLNEWIGVIDMGRE